jgi:hypothetical protein
MAARAWVGPHALLSRPRRAESCLQTTYALAAASANESPPLLDHWSMMIAQMASAYAFDEAFCVGSGQYLRMQVHRLT